MKFFDFGAFQKIEKLPSHDKILFHMLFGAFHDTSCNRLSFEDFKMKMGFGVSAYIVHVYRKLNNNFQKKKILKTLLIQAKFLL